MDITAKWSLFGEIIHEEISLESLQSPEYITGNLEVDLTNFRPKENEDDESGIVR